MWALTHCLGTAPVRSISISKRLRILLALGANMTAAPGSVHERDCSNTCSSQSKQPTWGMSQETKDPYSNMMAIPSKTLSSSETTNTCTWHESHCSAIGITSKSRFVLTNDQDVQRLELGNTDHVVRDNEGRRRDIWQANLISSIPGNVCYLLIFIRKAIHSRESSIRNATNDAADRRFNLCPSPDVDSHNLLMLQPSFPQD